MVRWNTGVQDDMIDLQETARSGGDRLDQEDWVRSTPMDTSYEEIPSLNEPKTYIEDAMSEDRINHDEILEHTPPVNKAPSVVQSEDDKSPTPTP